MYLPYMLIGNVLIISWRSFANPRCYPLAIASGGVLTQNCYLP